jgi:hypothetical protein
MGDIAMALLAIAIGIRLGRGLTVWNVGIAAVTATVLAVRLVRRSRRP